MEGGNFKCKRVKKTFNFFFFFLTAEHKSLPSKSLSSSPDWSLVNRQQKHSPLVLEKQRILQDCLPFYHKENNPHLKTIWGVSSA